jgi:oligopeptidase B
MDAVEEIILNQNDMSHEYMSLGSMKASPDHEYLAYTLDLDGSEKYQLFVKNLKTGEILEDSIKDIASTLVWSKDGRFIYYLTFDETQRPANVYSHELGGSQDKLIFEEPDQKFWVYITKSLSERYMFVYAGSSLTTEVHFLDLEQPGDLKLFLKRDTGHKYEVEHQGNRFLILTDGRKQYLNNRLCSCPVSNTAESAWEEVVPYDPYTNIESMIPFKNFIVLEERSGGITKLRVLESENGVMMSAGAQHHISFSEELYAAGAAGYNAQNYENGIFRYSYDTPLTAAKVVQYTLSTREKTILKEKFVPGGYDPSLYTMKLIQVPIPAQYQVQAPYNTPVSDKIPVSVLYKTSLFKGDGTNPLHLYGYGSYGISMDFNWSPKTISLLDRGFVCATAHIRGGGDCGKAW